MCCLPGTLKNHHLHLKHLLLLLSLFRCSRYLARPRRPRRSPLLSTSRSSGLRPHNMVHQQVFVRPDELDDTLDVHHAEGMIEDTQPSQVYLLCILVHFESMSRVSERFHPVRSQSSVRGDGVETWT